MIQKISKNEISNTVEVSGAEHIRTEKYDFFPFTCGYMKKMLPMEE